MNKRNRISIDRKELIAALPALKRAMPRSGFYKKAVAGMGVLVVDGHNAEIRSTDVESATLVRRFVAGVESDGFETLLPIGALLDFAKGSSSESITIEASESDDEHRVTFGDIVSAQTVPVRAVTDFPTYPNLGDDPFDTPCTLDAIDARDTLAFALAAASDDVTRYNLNGVYFDRGDESASNLPDTLPRFVSTDGHRLHTDECRFQGARPQSHIIPFRAVAALLDAIGKGKRIAADFVAWGSAGFTSTRATDAFRVGPWSIAYARIDGEFPNWRQVFPNVLKSSAGFDADDVRKACDSLAKSMKAAKKRTRFGLFSMGELGANLTADEGAHSFLADGNPQKFGINVEYFSAALKGFSGKRVQLRHAGEEGEPLNSPIRLDASGTRAAIVMPARL